MLAEKRKRGFDELIEPALKNENWEQKTTFMVQMAAATDRHANRRILLADDHALLRQGLANILEEHEGFEVVGQAKDGREAIRMAAELLPDVVLMDVSMPEVDGIEATREIKSKMHRVRVIGLSMHEDEPTSRKMREAGAESFLTKTVPPKVLFETIRRENRNNR